MPIYSNRVTCNTFLGVVVGVATCAIASLVVANSAVAQSETSIAGARGGVSSGDELDNYLRNLQTIGRVPLGAWGLRPFSAPQVDSLSKISGAHPWKDSWMFRADSPHHFSVLPLTVNAGFNSAFPWGGNANGVWAGRGLTTSVSGGVAAAWGPVSLVLDPMAFRAENKPFTLEPNGEVGVGQYASGDAPNNVDRPQRFGNTAYSSVDWGQSTLRLDWLGVSVGISSADQYWGPATIFPVILGNNAQGIPNVFVGTERPTNIGIGKVQAHLEYGFESQSRFSPVVGPDTFTNVNEPGTRGFMSGLVMTFSPAPIPGLELGAARFFHQAWSGHIGSSELESPFEGLLKNSLPTEITVTGDSNKDELKNQLASVFGRWVAPHSGFELYAEYGHEDHNADARDLELEPDHSRIAMVGFRKVFVGSDSTFRALQAEYIDATDPTLARHRGEGGVYTHTVLRQGHTENGQLLGADIGVGSPAGANLAVDSYSPSGRTRWFLERIVENNESPLLTGDLPSLRVQHLSATVGYERHRFGHVADLVYSAAFTVAKRGPTLPRETNLTATIGFIAHFP